ncbi:transposase [Streptomyces sp. NPDC018833]|uniref:transposase n=1 Tax=Streptomyces sp. NPDC018833 TaxID=3365053 RepID=UPI00379E9963
MNQSPWDHVAVLRAVAVKTVPVVDPMVWVIDDVSFPKDGKMSVAVARQWCGCLGQAVQLPGRSEPACRVRHHAPSAVFLWTYLLRRRARAPRRRHT